jgi:hypothetical protein
MAFRLPSKSREPLWLCVKGNSKVGVDFVDKKKKKKEKNKSCLLL